MRRLAPIVFAVIAAAGCQPDNQVVVPNRVLDRPLDAVLGCVRDDATEFQALSLNLCSSPSRSSCVKPEPALGDPPTVGSPQLVGFVANSERNEVAMFRRCDQNGLVDLDPEAPGHNLVPVGQLPSRIVGTALTCRVITANVGSCDMSVIDARELAKYAVELVPEGAPSSLVATLVPKDSDGVPLGSRPGDMLAVPDRLSGAIDETLGGLGDTGDGGAGSDDGGEPFPGATTDGGGGGGGDDGGDGLGTGQLSLCPNDKADSVYVAFPSCQMIAEVSVTTQRILQSRTVVPAPGGGEMLVDSGTDPVCPIECPAQFDGALPERTPTPSSEYYPNALSLLEPVPPAVDGELGRPEDDQITYSALYVGGTGSDTIFEIQFEVEGGRETGRWVAPEATRTLELDDAGGVKVIRSTPAMTIDGGVHQFLYIVAGDGSTRVVDRDFVVGALGTECDTQVDPTQVQATACHPIDPNAAGNAPERRPFAAGPGIRASGGATINDWTFQIVQGGAGGRAPFDRAGSVVGIGVSSFGRVMYAVFDQYEDAGPTVEGIDPVGVMRVDVQPHALWPAFDPHASDPSVDEVTALPRVIDDETLRSLTGDEGSSQILAPTMRRIDLAYIRFDEAGVVQNPPQLGAGLFGGNADTLGSPTGDRVYENDAPRVAVRDYRQWGAQTWTLFWEGDIPGTGSVSGRIQCDQPSASAGTCKRQPEARDAVKLIDDGATFCDEGVIAGDKLVILGCNADDDCGLGQKCLRDVTAPGAATGICISEVAFEQDFDLLSSICAPFIRGQCGIPRREYLITRAFQNELWIEEMDIPLTAHLREGLAPLNPDGCVPPGREPIDAPPAIREHEARFTCELPMPAVSLGVECASDDGCPPGGVCSPQGQCELGCAADIDCSPCFAAADQTACEADATCVWHAGSCFSSVKCRQGICRREAACDEAVPCPGDEVCVNGSCRAECPDGFPDCLECTEDTDCGHYGAGALCIDGQCARPCTSGASDCTQAPAPGPRCFAEFVRYTVRSRNSFLLRAAPSVPFIPDRVRADPDTQECLVDPTVSNLLTSRLPLGADEAETFGDPLRGIPDCVNPLEAAPTDPNPCRITTSRASDPDSLFHFMTYNDEPVEAIRFSNPFMSLVLDLVSVADLIDEPDGFVDEVWPTCAARFRRSRIPRGYREEFTAELGGYVPFAEPVAVQRTPLTYPVRIINAPEPGVAFIVDAGGRGGVTGVRGQIVRANVAAVVAGGEIADQDFRVR